MAAALRARRTELWETNSRPAERTEMRIHKANRAHHHKHGDAGEAASCLPRYHADIQIS
jgi:hypothetical protein